MALFVKDSGGSGDFTPIAEATYMARCIRVIDEGTQSGSFAGKPISSHKVMLMFELPGEMIMDKKLEKEMPMVFSKEFTLSLSEKSNLRPVLESLRGKKFTAEELAKGLDLAKVVGMPCSIEIFHKEKEGKVYPNVGTISGLLKGSVCPPAAHEMFAYDIDEGRCEKFYALPGWIQEKIQKSSDWKGGGAEGDPAFQGLTPEEQARQDALANPPEQIPNDEAWNSLVDSGEIPF